MHQHEEDDFPPIVRQQRRVFNEKIEDGYVYVTDKMNEDNKTLIVKCLNNKCKARGHYDLDENLQLLRFHFHEAKQHNHGPDPKVQLETLFKKALYDECISNLDSAGHIYQKLRILHEEAATTVTFPSIESSLNRWKKSLVPRMPRDLEEFGHLLTEPPWSTILDFRNGKGALESRTVLSEDGSISIIFFRKEFIAKIADLIPRLDGNFDATYKTTPSVRGTYQLATLMVMVFERALPVLTALMSKKTEVAYKDILLTFKREILPSRFVLGSIMTDYEIAMGRAFEGLFPGIAAKGCWFHYCQAIWRKATSLKIIQRRETNEEKILVLKYFMTLALLPAEDVVTGLEWILENISLVLRSIFVKFLKYFERYWMRTVTPQKFSVHMLIWRTNNVCESYHRVLVGKMGSHPTLLVFMREMVQIQQCAENDLAQLTNNERVSRIAKVKSILKDKNINLAWRRLGERGGSVHAFMSGTESLVGQAARDLAQIEYLQSQSNDQSGNSDENEPDEEDSETVDDIDNADDAEATIVAPSTDDNVNFIISQPVVHLMRIGQHAAVRGANAIARSPVLDLADESRRSPTSNRRDNSELNDALMNVDDGEFYEEGRHLQDIGSQDTLILGQEPEVHNEEDFRIPEDDFGFVGLEVPEESSPYMPVDPLSLDEMRQDVRRTANIRGVCLICYNRESDWLMYPCGHMALCNDCYDDYNGDTCVGCRGNITERIRVRFM